MAKEEEQGFVIRDKRGRGEEPTASESGRPAAAASSSASDLEHEAGHSHEPHPPVTFASFVF